MSFFSHPEMGVFEQGAGHIGATLLSEKNGCQNHCVIGVSIYSDTTYPAPGVHDEQEGFVVFSGRGYAKVGSEEHELSPQTVFIVPPLTPHAIRTDNNDEPVMVFWFHAAA